MDSSYLGPMEPDIALAVEQLNELAREQFEERAAILEFDAGMPRAEAERRALGMVLLQHDQVSAGSPAAGGNSAME
jgi:hypothetical protein